MKHPGRKISNRTGSTVRLIMIFIRLQRWATECLGVSSWPRPSRGKPRHIRADALHRPGSARGHAQHIRRHTPRKHRRTTRQSACGTPIPANRSARTGSRCPRRLDTNGGSVPSPRLRRHTRRHTTHRLERSRSNCLYTVPSPPSGGRSLELPSHLYQRRHGFCDLCLI